MELNIQIPIAEEIAPKLPKMETGREEDIRPGKTVMVIGSGGREHAIVDALSRSARVQKIYACPGNPGMSRHATCVNIPVTDVEALKNFAKEKCVDLTVVGPEASLAAGVADAFQAEGLRIFGPTKSAARIESSKEFAKKIMEKYNVPTGHYRSFDRYENAKEYAESMPLPTVIKYDGLAAGKGVVVAMTREDADAALRDMLLDSAFGQGRVLIEEFLDGPEFSFMCAVGGERSILLRWHRTTNVPTTATKVPTPAEWAPIPRSLSSAMKCATRLLKRSCSARPTASPTKGSSTQASSTEVLS